MIHFTLWGHRWLTLAIHARAHTLTCFRMAVPMLIAVAGYTRGEGSTIGGLPGESRSTELTELSCESCGTWTHFHPWSRWIMSCHIIYLDCRFKGYHEELRGVCKWKKTPTKFNILFYGQQNNCLENPQHHSLLSYRNTVIKINGDIWPVLFHWRRKFIRMKQHNLDRIFIFG